MSCPRCDQLKHGIRRALHELNGYSEWQHAKRATEELQQVLDTGVAFDAPLDPATLQSVVTWVPVSERLPEDGSFRLVAFDNSKVAMALYDEHTERWIWHVAGLPVFDVTHWAELPTPPASEEGEG